MNQVLIRITDHDGLDKNGLFEYLKKYETFGCFEEPHENPHYHFWLKTSFEHDTVQRHLKKIKGVSDRKFSVSSKIEGNLKYMCKGPKAVSKLKEKDYPGIKVSPVIPINTMGFTDAEIAVAHEEWWRDATDWKGKKEKNVKKDISWFEKLLEVCKSKGITASSNGWQIAAAIIDAYREYVKCEPNDFQIKCYAKSIQRQLVYEHAVANDKKNVYENYLKERAKQVIGCEWVHVSL